MVLLNWVYIVMSAFEPINKNDIRIERWGLKFSIVFGIEISILIMWSLDATFQLLHNWQEMRFQEYVTINATKFHESERSILLGSPIKPEKQGFFSKLGIMPLLAVSKNKMYTMKVILMLIFWVDFLQY